MNNREYWDEHYLKTNFEYNPNLNFFRTFLRDYGNQIKSPVLDLGCGDGRLLDILYQERINDLLGIDFSEKAISLARKNFPKISFLTGNIYNLDDLFEKSSFSLITSSMTLHHENYEISKDALADWISILKKDGLAYILTRSDSSLSGNEFKSEESTYFLKHINKNRVHFSKSSLQKIIHPNSDILNFEEVKYSGKSGAPITAWKVILRKK